MYQCSICYNDYNLNNRIPIILIPCGHTFCSQCIYKLQSYNYNECSLCRDDNDYVEINFIVFELIANKGKTNSQLQQLLTTKIRDILNSNIYKSTRLVFFNEFLTYYNSLLPTINRDNTSNSKCCIIS